MDETGIRGQVREIVLEILELEPDELDESVDLYALGGDSLQRLEVFARVEKAVGEHIDEAVAVQLSSTDDIVAELCRRA